MGFKFNPLAYSGFSASAEGATTAADLSYDNSTSGLTATDVQDAIDEVEDRVDGAEADITVAESDIDDLETLSGSAGATSHGTFTGITIPDNSTTKGALQALETEVELKLNSSEKGANNGVATLDAGGKVPSSQLPNSIMEYQGVWNATTNTPTLIDGTGNIGDVYRVTVAGSQDLGSGSISFDIGDYAIYNPSGVWEKSDTTDAVASVNSQLGIVVLDTDDISEGTNKYYASSLFDTDLATKDTDDLTEGATNKYYASSLFDTDLATKDTDDLAEGATNKYYASSLFDTDLATKDTDDLTEGTNLYFTEARAQAAVGVIPEASAAFLESQTNTTLFTLSGAARSAVIQLSVYIDADTDVGSIHTVEAIKIGSSWMAGISKVGSDDVILNVTSGGAVQYTSTTYAGFVSPNSVIKYKYNTTSV